MKIEIYGIDEADYRCGGCIEAKRIFDHHKLPYDFHKVITRNEEGFPKYDLDLIDVLKERAKLPTRAIMYPIIFIDGSIVRVKNLKTFLADVGFDSSDMD